MKAWKISAALTLLGYLLIAAFLWFRKVDGAGVVQTVPIKELNLLIWGIFGLLVLLGFIIWLVILKHHDK